MLINIVFFMVIIISVIRTVSYGIYAIKNDGKGGGISVFMLCAGVIFTGVTILCKQILQ